VTTRSARSGLGPCGPARGSGPDAHAPGFGSIVPAQVTAKHALALAVEGPRATPGHVSLPEISEMFGQSIQCHSRPLLMKCLSHTPLVIQPGRNISNGGVDLPDRSLNVGRDATRPESVLFGMLRSAGSAMSEDVLSTMASSLYVAPSDQSLSKRSAYGSRVPSFAKPRLTMYAAATHEAYRQPSLASRSASPTYTATKMATMAAIASMNSDVLKPDLASVKVLRRPLVSARRLAIPLSRSTLLVTIICLVSPVVVVELCFPIFRKPKPEFVCAKCHA
jgi:hypothetical protein